MSAPLSTQTQTLFAELLDRLLADSAHRSVAKAPGTFTRKEIRGETYVYFQFSEPGGRYRQLYLGKQGPAIDRLRHRFLEDRPGEARARKEIELLCSQILMGGAWSMGARPARVLKAFSDAGLFEAGAVLIGTHAFGLIGNLLGRRWAGAHMRTEDLDLAGICLATASTDDAVDAPGALERLQMGFLPVPGLDPRHPSTSFKVRGSALRVDFLTSGTGSKPVPLPRLGTCAQPLPHLDYLLEGPERAAVLDAGGFLALVPSPARFALHKMIVAGDRPVAQQTKSDKDFAQAQELLAFLSEARPGDIRLAASALRRRGLQRRLSRGWRSLLRRYPDISAAARLLSL